MKARAWLAGAGLALLHAARAAEPMEPLPAEVLQALCRAYVEEPASSRGLRCVRYVQGFLDGARVGDPRPNPREVRNESWIERAARTRLGARFAEFAPQRPRVYCPGDPPPVPRFIEQLLAQLDARPPGPSTPAREVLWQTLEIRFRCEDRELRHARR